MNPWTRRALLLPIALFICIAASVAGAAHWLHQRYSSGLSTLEPRIERLDGLIQVGSAIQTNLAAAEQTLGPWLHPASASAQTEVQQRLRQIMDSAGLITVALQSAEPDPASSVPRLKISATLTGSWPSAMRALQSLQQHRPAFWIQSIQLQREGRDGPADPQTVRLVMQIDAPLANRGAQ